MLERRDADASPSHPNWASRVPRSHFIGDCLSSAGQAGASTTVPDIRPFAAVKYVPSPTLKVSDVIAPPYDVLDEKQKATLQGKHPNNIVSVDLPFMPPKSVGPDEVHARANVTLQAWLSAGILRRDTRAATES